MRSVPLALTWEYLQSRRWRLLSGVLGATAMPAILLGSLQIAGGVDPFDPAMLLIHVVLVQICMLIVGSALVTMQSENSRIFTAPITATTIATWRLVPPALVALLTTATITTGINFVFHAHWPVWGPAIYFATAFVTLQGLIWLTDKSGWGVLGLTIVFAISGMWFKSRYGSTLGAPEHMWQHVTPLEIATMIAAAAIGYALGVFAIIRHRRGEPLRNLGIVSWIDGLLERLSRPCKPFRDGVHAQLWFEWSQKGLAMPIAAAFGMAVGITIWAIAVRDLEELRIGFIAGGFMLNIVAMIGAMIMGNTGVADTKFEISPFLATRPISSTAIARTILRTAARSVFFMWAIWACGATVVCVILFALGERPAIFSLTLPALWFVLATIVGPWLIVSIGTTLGMTGRPKTLLKLGCLVMLLDISGAMMDHYFLSPEMSAWSKQATTGLLGVLSIAGTAASYGLSYRFRLIGLPTILLASVAWVLMLCAIIGVSWMHRDQSVSQAILLTGISALLVAPFAAAPLALHWNRHR